MYGHQPGYPGHPGQVSISFFFFPILNNAHDIARLFLFTYKTSHYRSVHLDTQATGHLVAKAHKIVASELRFSEV